MILKDELKNDVYGMDVRVGFEECDPTLKMKVSDFLKYIVRTAGFHYDTRGISHKMMYDHGQVFVLSKLSLKINDLPSYGEKFTVYTWEKNNEKVYACRDFEAMGENGKILGTATSNWILINPHTRGILRPSAFDLCDYHPVEKAVDCKPCEKIRPDVECELIDTRTVRLSDTDANGHLHSAFYAYFITDALNIRTVPSSIELNFIKEARAGDVIELYANEGASETVITATGPEQICFTARITH